MPHAALWAAVEERHTAELLALLEAGADPNDERNGETCFAFALGRARYDEVILALFDHGGDLSRVPKRALNLVWATHTAREDVVAAFLDAGASIDVKAPAGTPLGTAAKLGNAAMLGRLIEAGADLDAGTLMGTPLDRAIEAGHTECALLLIEAGASLDPVLTPGVSLAASAVRAGLTDVLRALIAAGCDLEARATIQDVDDDLELRRLFHHATPLMIAAGEGHADCLELLIDAGVALDAFDDDGYGAVEIARGRGQEQIARRLLEAGAPETAERPPELELLMGAEAGDLDRMRAALDAGAAVDTHDTREEQRGRTPLMLAATLGRDDATALLLEAGADSSLADDAGDASPRASGAFLMRGDARGRTALHLAANAGHEGVVRMLLDAGADTTGADAEKSTPLVLAAGAGHAPVVRMLVSAGADVDQRGGERRTPLHAALEDAHGDAALVLIEAGAKVGLKDGTGETPLHLAALVGAGDAVRALLAAGADPGKLNRSEQTPLAYADDAEIRALLRAAGTGEAIVEARAAEDEDVEAQRFLAALARTPERPTPSLGEIEASYVYDRVLARLQRDAEAADFQQLLAAIGEACGSEPEDQTDDLGGYLFHVKTGRLDEEALESLQERMLERGAFVCCCGDGQPFGTPGRLVALPTRDRFDALVVFGTNGVNENKSTWDIIRWLAHREQVHPFALSWVEPCTLKGRFLEPIDDVEELACSMYDLCSDIVDQGTETLDRLIEELTAKRRLYFWWD